MRLSTWCCLVVALLLSVSAAAGSLPPAPAEHFGFEPGSDRRLIDYEQLIEYLEVLDEASPRLAVRRVGQSMSGRPMAVVFVSSADNLARLEELRAINRRLAIEELTEQEREQLATDGRVFVLVTLSMHSNEVGPAQALPLLAHELVTSEDAEVAAQLDEVVLMVVPTHNPDGMDLMVEHYRGTLGTMYEGASLPGVYNRYVGHDNNRDYVTLSQSETRMVNALYSTEWYPQVHVDKHQMGRIGPRYFVPEVHDPIAENVDEGLWTWTALFGAALANDMGRDGLEGIASHWLFDNYWPGPTETALWKGVISFLTEAASCKLATPVFVEPTELAVRGKGLSEYAKSVNLPDPWPGGWWRLGDIVRYELSSMRSILATAARHRADILRFRNELTQREIDKGRSEPPYYYVMPPQQHDRGALGELVGLLEEHGVRVYRVQESVVVEGRVIASGSVVVPLAQPYRAFVKEVLEAQRYPVRHYTKDGEVIRPYDVTSWSVPLHSGVTAVEVLTRSEELERGFEPVTSGDLAAEPAPLSDRMWGVACSARDNDAYRIAFAALDAGLLVRRVREAMRVGEDTLAAGSFLIQGEGASIARLVQDAAVPVHVLETLPEVPAEVVTRPRIGLVETVFHDMDAGWTRFLFDSFGIPYRVLRPGELGTTDLVAELDVLVFPDASKEVLTKARRKRGERYWMSDYPPELARPISRKGMANLVAFLDAGGIVVSWGRSTTLFLDGLPARDEDDEDDEDDETTVDLPARDVSDKLKAKGLLVPGAGLRARLTADHALTWGMPREIGVFSRGRPIFATSIPMLDMDRRVIAVHPEREVLMSGYVEHEELLARQPVMVWLRRGKGQLVLFGFGPQHRASTPVTYKLIFNSLLLPRLEE